MFRGIPFIQNDVFSFLFNRPFWISCTRWNGFSAKLHSANAVGKIVLGVEQFFTDAWWRGQLFLVFAGRRLRCVATASSGAARRGWRTSFLWHGFRNTGLSRVFSEAGRRRSKTYELHSLDQRQVPSQIWQPNVRSFCFVFQLVTNLNYSFIMSGGI